MKRLRPRQSLSRPNAVEITDRTLIHRRQWLARGACTGAAIAAASSGSGLGALAALSALSGCVSVELGQDQPAQAWRALHDDGRAQPLPAPLLPALLLQALPADAIADTASIAYSRQPHEYAFYQLASWTERPVRLVPRLLQRRLQQRNIATAVGQLGDPLRADWLLSIAIESLYHDVSVQPGQGRLVLVAELFDRRERQRVARQRFQTQAPAARADSAAGAQAMSQALSKCFDELLPWLEQALLKALPARPAARAASGAG